MHISAPFYPFYFRSIVTELKSKGLLNHKPLWKLDVAFLISLILTLLIFTAYGFWSLEIVLFCLFTFSLSMYVFFYSSISHMIIPYTIGQIQKATIVSEKQNIPPNRSAIFRKIWFFKFVVLSDEAKKVRRSAVFPFRYMKKNQIKYGDTVNVLSNPLNDRIFQIELNPAYTDWSLDKEKGIL